MLSKEDTYVVHRLQIKESVPREKEMPLINRYQELQEQVSSQKVFRWMNQFFSGQKQVFGNNDLLILESQEERLIKEVEKEF